MNRRVLNTAMLGTVGLAVGVTLPLLAYYHFVASPSTSAPAPAQKEFRPGSAVEAVLSHLPQVAVLGHKDGPSGTTEVFIQIPGVMNMQSVYVLADGKTVLSGFILPELEASGVPGGQLTYPTGEATVNVSDPRANMTELVEMLRGQSASPSEQNIASASSSPGRNGNPVKASSPADAKPVKVQSETFRQKVAELPQPPVPTQSQTATAGAGSTDFEALNQNHSFVLDVAPEQQAASPTQERKVMPSEREFTQMIKDSMSSDPAIERVRNVSSAKSQQAAYLDLVKSLPAVSQGQGDRHLYVFFDPNCPACHSYYQQMAPDVLSGEVTIHWIPSVVLPSQKSGMAVSAHLIELIEKGDASRALSTLGQVMRTHGQADVLYGELERTNSLFFDYINVAVKNTAVMAMAVPETPLIVYESRNGELVIEKGIPPKGYLANVKKMDYPESKKDA